MLVGVNCTRDFEGMLENWNSVGLYQDILPEEDALEAEL
jgi:hypothetical protein